MSSLWLPAVLLQIISIADQHPVAVDNAQRAVQVHRRLLGVVQRQANVLRAKASSAEQRAEDVRAEQTRSRLDPNHLILRGQFQLEEDTLLDSQFTAAQAGRLQGGVQWLRKKSKLEM